jgi:hypothetical protein
MAAVAAYTEQFIDVVVAERIVSGVAGEALNAGQAVKINATTGKYEKALATTTANSYYVGYTTKKVAAGEAVTVLMRGVLSGYDLSGFNYGVLIYLQDDGSLADTVGTVTKLAGRVTPVWSNIISGSPAKVLSLVDGF